MAQGKAGRCRCRWKEKSPGGDVHVPQQRRGGAWKGVPVSSSAVQCSAVVQQRGEEDKKVSFFRRGVDEEE
jgi:squalene cyclase